MINALKEKGVPKDIVEEIIKYRESHIYMMRVKAWVKNKHLPSTESVNELANAIGMELLIKIKRHEN